MHSKTGTVETRRIPLGALLLIGLVVAIALHAPTREAARFAVDGLVKLALWLAVGIVFTSALTASGAIGLAARAFGARPLVAVVGVSALGAVFPVCGITLLPLVAGLLQARTALAPVMAFMLSSAVTDPAMFAATTSTLGLAFATGKTAAALAIGIVGGLLTAMITNLGAFRSPMREGAWLRGALASGTCGDSDTSGTPCLAFWTETRRRAAFVRGCVALTRLVVLFLGVALMVEYFLRLALPVGAMAAWVGEETALAVPIAALVGAPLYLDGYAALPLVRGLMDRGMSDAAAMAFLISGGIVSAWTALPVLALVRTPVFIAYVTMAVLGAMAAGWGFGIAIG